LKQDFVNLAWERANTQSKMLQLKKSIRLESLRLPFKKALLMAAEIGADGIEINGRSELRASEMTRTAVRHLAKMLADLNLSVSAIHYPTRRGLGVTDDLDQRLDGIRSAMRLAYDLGCNIVVNKIGRIPEDPQNPAWTTMIQALTDLGNHSQKSGAWLAARTGSQSAETLKGLIDSLPIHSLAVDFDPGDFVINGFSPTEAMKILGQHVMSFRVRDAVMDLSQGRGIEVQLGRGSVDWPALLGALEENRYAGYLTVERDADENSVEQCSQAMEYLTNLFG
jgi:sugar phosphate isomerase/epimerase